MINCDQEFPYKFVLNEGNWSVNQQLPQARDQNGNSNNILKVPRQGGKPTLVYSDVRLPRKIMLQVHQECNANRAGIFMHQQSPDTIVVVRQFDLDYNIFDAYVTISRFSFGKEENQQTTVELPGTLREVIFAGFIEDGMVPKDETYLQAK